MSYSRVKIAARLRPPIPGEPHDDAIRVLRSDSGAAICVDNPRDPSQTFKYPFSSCYDQFSNQREIFDRDVKPLVQLAFSGITVTVFAYGVTSSGKTHTMQGSKDQPGVIPRAVEEIFRGIDHTDSQVSVAVSYMEIYKDEVYDLLVDRETAVKLPVRENEVGQVFVANLSHLPVDTLHDFHHMFSQANKQRSVSSTNLNAVSSRSHAILTLHITVVDPVRNLTFSGKLNLVDLAGSENNKLTGNDASRMAESAAINKSLSVLGQVVHALNQGASRIPYRNSKLTRILQDALGGSSVGLLICNLAPGTKFRQDTLNTLNFAVRTKNIQNKPTVNQSNAVAGPSKAIVPSSAPSHLAVPQPTQIRLLGPRPSRVPRLSSIEPRGSLPLPEPAPVKIEEKPPIPAHLTEEEINARIAKAVEVEVARRLQEERAKQREEEEAAAAAARNLSQDRSHDCSSHESSSFDSLSSLQSLPSGLLTPLLKPSRESHEEELKRRLDELEAKFERVNNAKAAQFADVLSPISRKKTGRAYVALARSHSQKNNLQVALELYRKAEVYVPDNLKLKERIIEIEWSVKNNRPFTTSPKRPRRSHSRQTRSKTSKRKQKQSECSAVQEEEDEVEADGSGKENVQRQSPGKRRIKAEAECGEMGTPPKKRRVMKLEE